MPYIPQYLRADVEKEGPRSVGALTYVIFKAMKRYVDSAGDTSFEVRSQAVAAAECAKLEFARRYLNAYEQAKLEENGDVTTTSGPQEPERF